jgi:hypothetical protein
MTRSAKIRFTICHIQRSLNATDHSCGTGETGHRRRPGGSAYVCSRDRNHLLAVESEHKR